MAYQLEDMFAAVSEEQRELQFGRASGDPLTEAFPRKRVVHAGVRGEVVPPAEAQETWRTVMNTPAKKGELQTAYVHIPFCKTKCLYCGFFQNAAQQSAEDDYVEALIEEIESAADAPRLKGGLIHAVFIGGGTPTSLSAENAARVLSTLRRVLPLANDYELTLEGRIHDLVPEKIEAWFANGVNRISLGVQSFDTKVRQSQGRIETREEVLERLRLLKSYEQCSVVLDLIYGLPGQSMEVWQQDLDDLIASGIDGADFYQLNVFEGSDLNKRIAEGKLAPAATTKEQAKMYAFAHDYMKKRGWRQLSMCHWACSSRERSLYNALAKRGVPMFPFGSSAGGFLGGYAVMLHRVLQPYAMLVASNQKPIMGLVKQSEIQPFSNCAVNMLEYGLMDLSRLEAMDERLTGLRWLYELWEKRGLVAFNGVQYELTIAGKFWEVNIAQTTVECIQYLLTGENAMSVERIAAQDKKHGHEKEKMHGVGMNGVPSIEMMQRMQKMAKGGMPSLKALKEFAKEVGIQGTPTMEDMQRLQKLLEERKAEEN
ncbi:heme anaerobic degradation radical SAM methyltransferase ChuW/HutW [uncultured Selenomonas sp.]|uniref:heme anaerobic degradation radical SAM methyltransferase ChuW/HutW n=1 Tax=uncultured Selenomonas sp. TaxID=159275 RepID=UPI002601DC20|nr:heme anaerobic degradation radical SAM methyltransferase ChuW/HutW [uncultured Selenomonas sp.]